MKTQNAWFALIKPLRVCGPALIALCTGCSPTGEGLVGPTGGEVETPEGVRIEVPPGALDREVFITAHRSPIKRSFGLGPAFVLEPEGLTFQKPVTVTLPYKASTDLPPDVEEPVFVLRSPGNEEKFENLGGKIIAPGLVQAQTMHFSTYVAGSGAPTVISVNDAWPQGLAVTDTNVFWTSYGTQNLPETGNRGNLMRATLDNPSPGQVGAVTGIANSQMDPKQMVVYGTDVYWTNGGSGFGLGDAGIMKVPVAGGTPTRIVTAPFPVAVNVNGVNIFWLDAQTNTVNKANMDGTSPVVLATTGTSPAAMINDGTYIYFLYRGARGGATGGIGRVPIAGGTATILVSGQAEPWSFTKWGTDLYWVNRGDGRVRTLWTGGGAPTTLRTLNRPLSIAIDGTYYFVGEGGTGRIMRYPLAGGAGTVRVSGQVGPSRLVLDSFNVFWTNDGTTKYTGAIQVINKN